MVTSNIAACFLLGASIGSSLVSAQDFSSYHYPGSPSETHFDPSYDFCIVGGGTAGMVLANRLTESGKHKVIVFEAGGPPTDVGSYRTPGGNQYVLNGGWSPIDYNYMTVPQTSMNNRTFAYHRGRALGGSSATNGLYYGLGSKSIYDQWESDGNPGWNWKNLQKMAKRGTRFVGNPNHTNDDTYMTWDPKNYGNGPLKIGFQGRVVSSNPSFMKALSAIGVKVVKDQNGGSPVGIKQGTMTLDENFMRSSAYDSYYMQAKDRDNLVVLSRSIVSRINFDKKTYGSAEVRAKGVTFVDDSSGVFHNLTCTKEVIVSSGAFNSPFLLKISGIGPKAELQRFGIEPLVVNENVGANMKDHTSFSVIHEVKGEFADKASTTDMINNLNTLNTEQRNFWKGGSARWNSKWSAPSGCTNGFQEISNAELKSFGAGDIVKKGLVNQAQNEILYESIAYPAGNNGYYQPSPNKSYISVTVSNLAALSLGSVKIGSNQGTSDPVIDPNYLSETADQKMAIQGVKYLRKIMQHPEMKKWSAREVSPGPDVTSDKDLLEYAKNTMVPNWHASGTCVMLPKDKKGVVDSHLRVYGTKGLRVIDVSTFGRLPDVNLVGSVYMAAEMGADIVRKDHGDA